MFTSQVISFSVMAGFPRRDWYTWSQRVKGKHDMFTTLSESLLIGPAELYCVELIYFMPLKLNNCQFQTSCGWRSSLIMHIAVALICLWLLMVLLRFVVCLRGRPAIKETWDLTARGWASTLKDDKCLHSLFSFLWQRWRGIFAIRHKLQVVK